MATTQAAAAPPKGKTGKTVPLSDAVADSAVSQAPEIPTKSSALPSGTPAVGAAELARNNAAYSACVNSGTPVRHNNAEAVGFWIGAVLSSPVDLFVTGQRYLGGIFDNTANVILSHVRKNGGAWYLLAPFAFALKGVAQIFVLLGALADAPLKLPRLGIRWLAKQFEGEKTAPLANANFRRAQAWPHLPINAPAEAAVKKYLAGPRAHFDTIIVPGVSTDSQTLPLSDEAKQRLSRAAHDLSRGLAPFIVVSGGNVHPAGTPFNEAYEMRRYLIETLHVAPEKILVEPFAQHTPTNLRNAGRLIRSLGLQTTVVTSTLGVTGQMLVFNRADSLFGGDDTRALIDNGTLFGRMHPVDFYHCAFTPDDRVDLVKVEDGEVRDEIDAGKP